jgi:hypothetical protein
MRHAKAFSHDPTPPTETVPLPVLRALLPAWLPAARAPNGALLLGHLSQHHRDQVKAFVDRMQTTDDITPVAAEGFEVVEEHVPQ